jgi:two-component system, NarL family, response regulator LiaR
MTERIIRVLIADDHEIVREGLETLLSEDAGIEIVGQASSGQEAIALAKTLLPDVVLMDVVMPGVSGIEATRAIRQTQPATQVLVLTSYANDEQVHSAIQSGAIGYLMKDVLKSELMRAIRAAADGKPTLDPEAQRALMHQAVSAATIPPHNDLSERELEVLRLAAQGKSNKEIGNVLHLTEGTVKGYMSAILAKLGVADRTQAALYAVKHHLVSND